VRSDEELVTASLEGGDDAFDELMKRYERLVYKVAYSFGGSREDALDITQSVFLKAFRSLSSFRSEANLKTWLMRITYNEGINWVRKSGRTTARHAPLDENIASNSDQERDLVAREKEKLLEKGLETLNERYRLAIVLRYQQGLPIGEIAAVLQCSEGVTKNMLFRGIRTLRQALSAAMLMVTR
jgi:RNA polymerase sigma-70 factor, ECF subfamily